MGLFSLTILLLRKLLPYCTVNMTISGRIQRPIFLYNMLLNAALYCINKSFNLRGMNGCANIDLNRWALAIDFCHAALGRFVGGCYHSPEPFTTAT